MLGFPSGSTIPVKNIRTADTTAAANTTNVITIAAVTTSPLPRIVIQNMQWSYSTTPTGGRLFVQTGSGPTTVFDIDVITAVPGGYNLVLPAEPGEQVIITLAAGGGTAVGKLNVQYATVFD